MLSTQTSLRHEWVTLGFFQQDDLERHFAHFRISAGCNFFISVEDATHTHNIDRTRLLLSCETEIDYSKSNHVCDLCNKELTDAEINLVDNLTQDVNSVSLDEKMSLLYIGGYVASKHPSLAGEASELDSGVANFIDTINRGGLSTSFI